ncbi:queuosine precursor transporter [Methanosphaera sp. ISO3-F5]|uniref:queuosine precursor transporter n=1 Tax=Methanosphaera sp. ISO3-F5 TaxID=1452353 RepID=UPI002B25FD4C|nr:queuosine precursor transporter [Methanosphaera sp. ISO3-F5]WQH63605.1 queuosine precursor transporter [Methanosphaera sp. ISO3-F5]
MNQNQYNKTEVYALLTGIATASLIISNILAFKTFTMLDIVLPTAVIIFPVIYIVNDVLAETYGFQKARQVILLGFIMNFLAVILYNIAIILPAPVFFEGAEAFQMVLSNSLRVLVASFSAYLIGSLVNAYVMVYLKKKFDKYLFARCILSTICGEGLDAIIFITIAFIGTMPIGVLLTMIIAQAAFKTVYEIIVYPLTKMIISKIRSLPEN